MRRRSRFARRASTGSAALSTYGVYEVFTPTSQAKLNFVPRLAVNDNLVAALRTPGKQVIVYGETGSGKSTLLQRKLEELYTSHITSRCTSAIGFDQLLLDAFDKLSPFYVNEMTASQERGQSRDFVADFSRIRASIDSSSRTTEGSRSTRAVPPQLTPQRLGELMGAMGLCWVLEDFHKVPDDQKRILAQSMKTFSDLGAEFPLFKVVAIGATETARLVVQYDVEMTNRVGEILVPLMNEEELGSIIDQGQGLLNVDLSRMRDQFVKYSVGVASVCHQLSLNVCLNNDVLTTLPKPRSFAGTELEPALKRWVEESSDTLKATFDKALRRHRVRQYDNCRLILQALARGPFEGMLRADILRDVRKEHPDYPAANLTQYLRELTEEERGSIIRIGVDGRYRFFDPLHHTFAQAALLPTRRPAERTELYVYVTELLSDTWTVDMTAGNIAVEFKSALKSPSTRNPRKRN